MTDDFSQEERLEEWRKLAIGHMREAGVDISPDASSEEVMRKLLAPLRELAQMAEGKLGFVPSPIHEPIEFLEEASGHDSKQEKSK